MVVCCFRSALFVCFLCILSFANASYNVHWIDGVNRIEQNTSSSSPLNIYCYKGRSKYFLYLWHSVVIHIDIDDENFNQYIGYNCEEVWNAFKADKTIWNANFFTSKKSRYLHLEPFNQTCFAIGTHHNFSINIHVQNTDYRRMSIFIAGVFLFLWARNFSENPFFYYIAGISIGIGFSLMVLVYIVSKMLPGKPVMYGTMIGGWAVGLYFFQFLWSNFQSIVKVYSHFFLWYILITGFISFVICYIRGPPKDMRSKNIITWTLQIFGLIAIYYSSNITEAVILVYVVLLIYKYIPFAWLKFFRVCWMRKYPPKRVLLTEQQFYEEGIKETAKALDELREYCSSPECKQWDLVRKLKNPTRFASFIEYGGHVNDTEIEEYDTSDFVIHRPKCSSTVRLTSEDNCFVSEDSSSSSDEI